MNEILLNIVNFGLTAKGEVLSITGNPNGLLGFSVGIDSIFGSRREVVSEKDAARLETGDEVRVGLFWGYCLPNRGGRKVVRSA